MNPKQKRIARMAVPVVVAGVALGLVASWLTGTPQTEEATFAAPETFVFEDEASQEQPDDDADDDGLADAKEAELGTDPHDADTDNDFYSDLTEYEAGTDPLDSSDHPNNDIQQP